MRAGYLRGQEVGSYLLVDRLGGGAMATVYRAVDRRNQRQVAVKILLPDADAVMRERFRREAQTHSVLEHPHIVRIFDVGESLKNGLTYIVMELVDGPNLSEVMEETLRISTADAARVLEPIARALDYSSRQGIIHRDVKPSNVLLRRVTSERPDAIRISGLDEPIVPLLSDFGIARALDAPELTSAGRTIGTPTYMAPEQCADSHEIDGRSDLYSLGAVFYRCIVGRPPYSGTTTQILHAHVYDPLTIPEEVLGTLPPAAVTILRRSLAKKPGQRYANGAEMAADLATLRNARGASRAGDDTATMATLPSIRHSSSQAVLIPGPDLPAATGSGGRTSDFIPVESAPLRAATPADLPARRPRQRWIGALVGAALAALVLIGGGGLAVNLLPEGLVARFAATPSAPVAVAGEPIATAAATPVDRVAVDIAAPVAPAPEAVTALPSAVAPPPLARDSTAPAAPTPSPLPSPPPARAAGSIALLLGTPSVLPTPAGSIDSFWEEAKAAYGDQDWDGALAYLTLVRRMDPQFERTATDEMLFDSWTGLAARYLSENEFQWALELLNAALTLRPDERVGSIARELNALAAPDQSDKQFARWTLAKELRLYGTSLAEAGKPCLAAAQLEAAGRVKPDEDVPELVAQNRVACVRAKREEEVRTQLRALRGRLLYSTQEGNRYRIYRMPAEMDGASTLLVEDATQPAQQLSGNLLAFHSTDSAAPGIGVLDLRGALPADARGERLTTAPEDARDAPPSWNSSGRRLAYGSTAGDGRARIYTADGAGSGDSTSLALGQAPAWRPVGDIIVYNGVDDAGGSPGLWLMSGAGGERNQLTDNGNDIRPTWTPDGQSVVFMSQRDGNYELYRIDLANSRIMRLTNHPAQDGLSAVSPDGKWIAFASDRGGFWRIWVTPIDGGEVYPLANINGELTNWLEHAIQWVP